VLVSVRISRLRKPLASTVLRASPLARKRGDGSDLAANNYAAKKADTGKRPHELMLEWVQIGAMEAPERVKKGYFVKKWFALSASMHFNLAKACAPYYAAKITHQARRNRDQQAAAAKCERLVSDVLLRPSRDEPEVRTNQLDRKFASPKRTTIH
jgi:hypothetical protein